ncbi:MAG: recombination mediator RecR [Candidatus Ancillula sp.]|jgi:recombination protein RecR|nr:recombination mediator RecR [Candidatus Ancillula sp.]
MNDELILNLIDKLAKLPGVGPKSATRIAYFLLDAPTSFTNELSSAIIDAKTHIVVCSNCGNTSSTEVCYICSNPKRAENVLLVVEEPRDLIAIEKTHEYFGKYLVLGGALNPMAGIKAEHLRINLLMKQVADPKVEEVILATNPNVEGEVTASYIARMLAPMDLRVTRIATGLPMGADLEFADEVTLGKAIEKRQEFGV